jgi:hypothetical protein
MATPRLTHVQRGQAVLNDLETNFPEFAGQPNNQLHQNLPELALIEENQQVATKPDESLSPSLFTSHSHFASIRRN